MLPRLVCRMHRWRFWGCHHDAESPASLAMIEADLAAGLAPHPTEDAT
ncbi:MAG: hypothetical protein QF391_00800 [Myxococcota bacterium]|nr:hypothetical protein [Myxococcota bacterium]